MELTATFEAQFGRAYKLHKYSPAEAWEMFDKMMDIQSIIANLLDPEALNNVHYPYGRWWELNDVMDSAIAQQIIIELGHLLTSTAYVEARIEAGQTPGWRAVDMIQCAIAGMLHPRSYELVTEPTVTRQAS